jgi:ABC-type branched-subunit amino acid transport system ATPase component
VTAASEQPVLSARAVTMRFGGLVAVNQVDLEIPHRSIISLIGPNGAGKTTLFNVIAGILEPTSGAVELVGRRMVAPAERAVLEPVVWVLPAVVAGIIGLIAYQAVSPQDQPVLSEVVVAIALLSTIGLLVTTLLAAIIRPRWYHRLLTRLGIFRSARPSDMVHAGIGRTFQNIRLFQNMTALENVLVGMHIKLQSSPVDAFFSTPRKRREEARARERARELLRLVGLPGRDEEMARNLPYGDQRRLEVARAVASEPALLLLDEPTAGMNPRETAEMTELIDRLRRDLGLAVLLIEHDMRVVMGISDRITVLDHGERIAEGTPLEVRSNPRVIEAYLGSPAA